jgi:GPH family glycoside/pentoside/hexuronide:cation symporter
VRAEKFSLKPFGDLFRNRPWVILTLIGICMNFFNGFRYAVAGYMFEYCLHGDVTISGLIINYTVFMTFGELTCMVFGGVSPVFTKWVGSKRKAFMWAAAICVATSVVFFLIPMDAAYIWLMVAIVIITSIGIGIYSPLLWSMYADVSDYATEKNGTSSTGLIFSSGTMAQKFGTAISGSLVALLLGIAGFISGTDADGQTVITITDADSVNSMIWALFSVFPAIIAGIMMGLLYLYPIKK